MIIGFLCPVAGLADGPEKARPMVAALCASCHGLDGNSTDPNIPKLAGRNPESIAREMKDFISGRRRSEVAEHRSDDLDSDRLKLLGAHFGSQMPMPGKVLDPAAAAEGKRLYLEGNEESGVPACDGCHGSDGSGSARFPRLAGQHRQYLVKQLQDFSTETRKTTRVMREVASRLTEAEIKMVVEFLHGL